MRPLELTPSGVVASLVILAVVAACVRLGIWQLDRRTDRLERNRAVAERLDSDPIALRGAPADTAGLSYRRVRVEGEIDEGRMVVLAGRSRGGAPGVHVLAPVRAGDGAILVNLGWLPAPDAATADPAAFPGNGRFRIEGVLLPFPDVELDARPDSFRTTWFRLDGEAIRSQFPYRVAPLYVRATRRPAPAGSAPVDPRTGPGRSAAGPVPLDPPALDAGPHLSYAVQWFSFAAIFAIGWAVLLVRGTGRGASPRASSGREGTSDR